MRRNLSTLMPSVISCDTDNTAIILEGSQYLKAMEARAAAAAAPRFISLEKAGRFVKRATVFTFRQAISTPRDGRVPIDRNRALGSVDKDGSRRGGEEF